MVFKATNIFSVSKYILPDLCSFYNIIIVNYYREILLSIRQYGCWQNKIVSYIHIHDNDIDVLIMFSLIYI